MRRFASTTLGAELLAEVRSLHFQTKRLVDQTLLGQYRSAFQGHGIEFEEVREYVAGDDIRAIDWNVTARTGKPFIKSYREERDLTVMLAVDVSRSTYSGVGPHLRQELLARVGAALTLIALNNNDRVGLITYSDRLETYHPPRRARGAVWRILHEILAPAAYHAQTDLAGMFGFLRQVLKRRAIIFILSDFIDRGWESSLSILAKRHDVTAIIPADESDVALPEVGLWLTREPETGKQQLIDTSDSNTYQYYIDHAREVRFKRESSLAKLGVDTLELLPNQPIGAALRAFFNLRQRRVYRERAINLQRAKHA